MDLELEGRVALVTGASAGHGRAIAAKLAREGCRVAIVARRESLLQSLADEIAARSRERPLVLVDDVTDTAAAPRLRRRVLAFRRARNASAMG